jgi:nucleoside-diphosphate-sugar epimerase
MTERVLIAGCGDLGTRLAHRLLARGAEVWALRRQPPTEEDTPANTARAIHWLQADLTQPQSLSNLPSTLTQVVYTPTPGARSPDAYRAVFQDGLISLLRALDQSSLKKVLFVSSTAVYGEHHGDWIDETTPANPSGFNGRILLETEHWLADQAFSSVSLRLAGLYGPGRLQLLERLRAGSASAPIDPIHWANRIHIDDAASAADHLLAYEQTESVYIGSDGTPLPLHVLYAYLADLIHAKAPAEGPPPANVGSKKMRNSRLIATGWTPQWPDARMGYQTLIQAS